jgi:hypothetical protein
VQVLYGLLLQPELHPFVPDLYKENASVVIGDKIMAPTSSDYKVHCMALAACKDWRVHTIDAAVTGDNGLLVTICSAHVGDADRTQIFHQALVLDRSDGAWRVATEIARISDKGLFEPAPVSRELDPNRSTPELASTEETAAGEGQEWWDSSTEWREETGTGQKTWHERQSTFRLLLASQTSSNVSHEEIENACWEVLAKDGWSDTDLQGVSITIAPAKGEGKGGMDIVVGGNQCQALGRSLREGFATGRHASIALEERGKGSRPYENSKRRGGHFGGKGNRPHQRNGTAAWSESRDWNTKW